MIKAMIGAKWHLISHAMLYPFTQIPSSLARNPRGNASIRHDLLHSLMSIVRTECVVMGVTSRCNGGDVALETLVGHLQLAEAGSLVRC